MISDVVHMGPNKGSKTYGFSSVQQLWDASNTCNNYVSVDVKNPKALSKFINPCSVSIRDIKQPLCCHYVNLAFHNDGNFIEKYTGNPQTLHLSKSKKLVPNTSTLTCPNGANISKKHNKQSQCVSNSNTVVPSDTTIGEFTIWKSFGNKNVGRLAADKYKPFGLKNFTGTCCYMNSLIQVLLCICSYDKSNPTDIHILNNKEGKLVQDLLGFPIRMKEARLSTNNPRYYNKPFVNKFANIEKILDGKQEQDVYECFGIIKGIMEKGTRTCLLENVADATAEMFTSLPQFWFEHRQKVTYICNTCNSTKDDYEIVSEHHLVPLKDATTLKMLSNSLEYVENRGICDGCSNINYTRKAHFTDHPRILCLLIKRYTYENGMTNMNSVPVKISREMFFDDTRYELISVIHHHRNRNTRHYTSTVKYLKYFHINDSVVQYQQFEDLDKSKTAYLVMYRQTAKLQCLQT